MTTQGPVTVDIEVDDDSVEKPWWRSKKWWIWFVSFVGLWLLELAAMRYAQDWRIQCTIILSIAVVTGIGLLGIAWVDAAVRFAKAWRGTSSASGLESAMRGVLRPTYPPSEGSQR